MTEFFIPTETLEWGSDTRRSSIALRGLSFDDFTKMFTQYGKTTDDIFQFLESVKSDDKSDFDAKAFGADLIAKAPKAVASLIALAADMPDREASVARMPLPVQIRALEVIYRLTIEEAGGLADFLDLVLRIAKGVSQKARLMNSQQINLDLSSTGT